jgi:uncharacterized membrane protein YhdT
MKYLWFVCSMVLMAWFGFRVVFDLPVLFVLVCIAAVLVAIKQIRLDRVRRE